MDGPATPHPEDQGKGDSILVGDAGEGVLLVEQVDQDGPVEHDAEPGGDHEHLPGSELDGCGGSKDTGVKGRQD